MGRYPPPAPTGLRIAPGEGPWAGGAPCNSAEARGLPGGGRGVGKPPTTPRAAHIGELPLLSDARFYRGSAARELRARQRLPHGTQSRRPSSGGQTGSRVAPLSQECRTPAQLRLGVDSRALDPGREDLPTAELRALGRVCV